MKGRITDKRGLLRDFSNTQQKGTAKTKEAAPCRDHGLKSLRNFLSSLLQANRYIEVRRQSLSIHSVNAF